jgi:hypothetical protein
MGEPQDRPMGEVIPFAPRPKPRSGPPRATPRQRKTLHDRFVRTFAKLLVDDFQPVADAGAGELTELAYQLLGMTREVDGLTLSQHDFALAVGRALLAEAAEQQLDEYDGGPPDIAS